MATFEIPEGPVTAKVSGDPGNPKSPRTGSAVFNVTNKSEETRAGRLSVQTAGEAKKEWFTIEGDQERKFGPGETQTASIKIDVPPEVKAGDYPFRLRIVAVNDPDNDHTDGPASTAQVVGAGGGGKKIPIWVWILIALVVLAGVGFGVYKLLGDKEPEPIPTPTPTPTPTPEPPVETTDAEVPTLVGQTLASAKTLAQDFELVPVAGKAGGKPPDTILEQTPEAGKRQTKGFPVRVTFDPGVEVPKLQGTTQEAVQQLSRVGLQMSNVTTNCNANTPIGQVVDQNPKAGQKVALKSGVSVVVGWRANLRGDLTCGLIIRDVRIFTKASTAVLGTQTATPIVRDHRQQ